MTGGGPFARKITMTLIGEAKAVPGRTPVSLACESACCTHPTKPAFKTGVDPSGPNPCAALTAANWAGLGPSTPADPVPSAAALVAVPPPAGPFGGGQKLPWPDYRSLN